ncbi:hypothetical protein CL619_01515 [archaeon]|nr:hypothetical protein [archaeon]|tara:strand:- start:1568 stop:2443 length:876 start_codon:yes stop_codon:yes gene_type:complete
MEWIFLALLAPFFWAIVVLLDDNLLRYIYKNPFFGAIISGLFASLPLFALFFFPITIPSITIISFSIAAGILIIGSYTFYFHTLQERGPSITVALWSMSPALIAILALIFLGEKLSGLNWLGFLLIFSASLIFSITNIKKFTIHKSFWLMLGATSCAAFAAVLSKYIYLQVNFWTGFVLVSLGMFIAAIILMLYPSKGRKFIPYIKKNVHHAPIFVFSELLNVAAIFVSHLAISRGPVSLVKVIGGVQPVYILLISLVLFPFFPRYFRKSEKLPLKSLLLFMILLGLWLMS